MIFHHIRHAMLISTAICTTIVMACMFPDVLITDTKNCWEVRADAEFASLGFRMIV